MAPGIGCIDCSKQKKINKVSAQSRIDQDTDRVNQEVQTMERKTANICIFFLSLVLAAQVLIPASAETDTEAVNAFYASVLEDSLPILSGEPEVIGKLLIAVWEYGENVPRLSLDEANADGYHGIPADRLASCLADAQTLVLIYPTVRHPNPTQTNVDTTVCLVNLTRNARYESWTAGSKLKLSFSISSFGRTSGGSDISMDVDQAMASVLALKQAAAKSSVTASPTLSETDIEVINTLYQDVLQDRLTVLPGEPVPAGKLLIAVYDVGKEKPRLSPNEAVEDGYHGIPAVKLASGLSDAQTLILLYPTERSVRFRETLIGSTLCVIDLSQNARYETWWAGSQSQVTSQFSDSRKVSLDIDQAMASVLDKMEAASMRADEALYRQAEEHFAEGLYYTACQEFRKSLYGDWAERAAACILPWPENGEVWQNDPDRKEEMRVTIQVEHLSDDKACFVRLYREDEPVSGLFISGSGEASVDLSAGAYMFRIGFGSLWYGGRELFGKTGSYNALFWDETPVWDSPTIHTVELKAGFSHKITISLETVDDGGGIEPDTWENIVE